MKRERLCKFIITLFVFLTGLGISAQSGNFELSIRIHHMKPTYELALGFMTSDKSFSDKVRIRKLDSGNYVMSGWIPYPSAVRIEIKSRKASRYFYITKGKQYIDVDYDSLSFPVVVNGSRVNEEYLSKFISYMQRVKEEDDTWWKQYGLLREQAGKALPAETEDSMRKRKASIDYSRDSLLLQYCRKYPDSYVAFWKLYDYFRFYGYTDAYEKSLKSLSGVIQQGFDGRYLESKLMAGKSLAVGAVFPDFILIDTAHKSVRVSDDIARSKYTLIDFWYSHCTPCIAQFADFSDLYAAYANKGFEIIGVSTDLASGEKDWLDAINRYKIPWKSYWTKDGVYARKYFIEAFPTNFLVDQEGRILVRDISVPELKNFMTKQGF